MSGSLHDKISSLKWLTWFECMSFSCGRNEQMRHRIRLVIEVQIPADDMLQNIMYVYNVLPANCLHAALAVKEFFIDNQHIRGLLRRYEGECMVHWGRRIKPALTAFRPDDS